MSANIPTLGTVNTDVTVSVASAWVLNCCVLTIVTFALILMRIDISMQAVADFNFAFFTYNFIRIITSMHCLINLLFIKFNNFPTPDIQIVQ